MIEIDELDRQMDDLKRLITVAWSNLANSALPPLEYRETLDQVKLYSAELRRCLEKMNRSHIRGVEFAEKPKLRRLS
jgi:hypothetical protein